MAIYVANNGQLQTIKGIYYVMTEDYINATRFHNLVPKTATEIKFLYASDNPDLTGYQKLGYCDNNNFIEVWNSGTKYILINPRKNYIYAPINCYQFLYNYPNLSVCIFDNFNTQNVRSMQQMFYLCGSSSLTLLDLTSFNTENVTNMKSMFASCRATSLDLTSFNTANVADMSYMFNYCGRLITIISNSFVLKENVLSPNMFTACTQLIGGNGTTFSSSHITAKYARVDGENNLPGYFTAPTN